MSDNPAIVGDTLAELIRAELAGCTPTAQRIIANRIKAAIESWIEPGEKPLQSVPPMTDQEAFLFKQERMEFGKYTGQCVCDVPLDYLEWLADASRKTWRQIHGYLNSPRVKQEREAAEAEDPK